MARGCSVLGLQHGVHAHLQNTAVVSEVKGHERPSIKCKSKGKGVFFNVGGQTGQDCLLTRAGGVKVANCRIRTGNLSL